ncbi:DUF1905 domain-containing protein [Mycobacterium intracellulare]|uniref:DUF1905 domain-containing protein n=1 Tax=Mycobacterium intracellulare TaxID=1767 RepID=UPI0006D9A235|nr:DUF1905 domain-containing protein [Mycobacterium intracellulare]KPN49467.1 hypothetical protein AN933_21940 [Mycobacterium intracellulare subsp. chimaera]
MSGTETQVRADIRLGSIPARDPAFCPTDATTVAKEDVIRSSFMALGDGTHKLAVKKKLLTALSKDVGDEVAIELHERISAPHCVNAAIKSAMGLHRRSGWAANPWVSRYSSAMTQLAAAVS